MYPLKDIFAPSPPISLPLLQQFQHSAGGRLLLHLLKLTQIDALFKRNAELQGLDFVSAVLRQLGITYTLDAKELANLPASGPFIVVANHPYGALDGLLLLEILKQRRPDAKLMANDLLATIPNLAPVFLPVNPFNATAKKNISGLRQALEHLKEGSPLGIFPAGEVSTWQIETQKIVDRPWSPSIGKLLAKANVPVVPVHFSGHNSLAFQLMSLVHPTLQTARLPAELLNKKGHHVQVRIGRQIKPQELLAIPKPELLAFVRAKTYSLAVLPISRKTEAVEEMAIASETDPQAIWQEIEQLPAHRKIVSHLQYDVYLARAAQIPQALREIGRLREYTFRQVGEGTHQPLDLDQYDHHYQHLFLYDREARQIVGAYRLGKGKEIWKKQGKRGFYLHSLFKIKKELTPLLKQSLELGRSFVRPEYQRKNLPLLLLWKGLSLYLEQRPEYKYLIGPVSISSYFSNLSQSLMVRFIKDQYFDHSLARFVKPRKAFKAKLKTKDHEHLLANMPGLQNLDTLIKEIEPQHTGVPPLLKKYLLQNARIIGFNIDPLFSDSLDGFMVMNVHELPKATQQLFDRVDGQS